MTNSEQETDEVSRRQIDYIAKKWAIPEYEAKRMLKNHEASD